MGIARSTNLRGVVLTLLAMAIAPSSSYARPLLFSSEVPRIQVAQVKKDLSNNLTLVDGKDVEQVMGIRDLSDASLKQWLSDRVGFIVGENESEKTKLVGIQKYQYQNPGVFPNFEEPAQVPEPQPSAEDPQQKVYMVMANVGTSSYYIGKSKGPLIGYKFASTSSAQTVAISSPRVGIIKIGEGLFGIVPVKENKESLVNTWFRLSTLFHEAHHSDGNATSLGFPHAVCPEGHQYYNLNACDREGNGPYAVGAYVTKQARLTCLKNQSCSASEAEKLALIATDSISRVLAKNFIDPKPEGTVTGVVSGL